MHKTRSHNRNFYTKVQAMQAEYMKHRNSGHSEIYVYRKFIYPRFFISRSTFYNWLAINPRKELERLTEPDPTPTVNPTVNPTATPTPTANQRHPDHHPDQRDL